MKNKIIIVTLIFLLFVSWCPWSVPKKNISQEQLVNNDPVVDWEKAYSHSKDSKNNSVLLVIRDAMDTEGGLDVIVFFGDNERRIGRADFPPLTNQMTFCYDITHILLHMPEIDPVETRIILRDKNGFDSVYRKIELRLCDLRE